VDTGAPRGPPPHGHPQAAWATTSAIASRIRVYIASSLDGFIAGEHDDLCWLPQPEGEPAADSGFGALRTRAPCSRARRHFDGGDVIRQALDAGLLDELAVSVIPVGGGVVELVYRPRS